MTPSEILSDLRYRLRVLFGRGRTEQELDAELRFHLDRETDKLVAQGYPRADAERRARLAFGGMERIKDDARDARGVSLIETFLQDVRYAARGLRSRRAFSAGVILTLGLGIGANAAMFGVVDRMLFRAPPTLRDPGTVHRIYRARHDQTGDARVEGNFAFPTFLDVRRLTSSSFSDVAAFQTRHMVVGEGEDAVDVPVTVASAKYFDFFDARAVLGRFYTAAQDSVPEGAPVVVLGYGFWQARFGGRNVVGEHLRVDRMNATIIGVAPQSFVGMPDQGAPAAFVPITAYAFALRGAQYPTKHSWSWLEMVARRRPNVSEGRAQADLDAALVASWRGAQAEDAGWGSPEDVGVHGLLGPVQLGRGPEAGPENRVATWVSGVALIVLLIACANVANLMLARAVSRRREIAMRLALGVSRGRLVRQLLTESALLAVAGGVVGLFVAQWGGSVIRALFLPPDMSAAVLTDTRTLVFTAILTVSAALVTGALPAFGRRRLDVASVLKAGEREGGERRTTLRKGLLVFQAALSVLLLVGAGLFVKSLTNARAFRLGYDTDRVVMAGVQMRGLRLDSARSAALGARLLSAAQSTPGITHAALAASVPFWSNEGRGLWVSGIDSVDKLGHFILQIATPDYFATMGTRILRGRPFTDGDRVNAPHVVVVSEGMARALWPHAEALGQCIHVDSPSAPCATVVGVAEEVRMRKVVDPREFSYYLPAAQFEGDLAETLLARTRGDAEEHVAALRSRLQAELPAPAYVNVVPLTTLVDPNFRAWRFGATMFAAFGALALVLAAIGLYSLIAYDVAQRTRELSVRIALGAPGARVVRMVIGRGLLLVTGGLLAGGAIAAWLGPRVQSLMFEQDPRDPVIFGGVALVVLLIGVVATAGPAFRAARVDPAEVLRGE
ncbi:MAG TPA: ADOP family duplicated permease [Gemmatimonadaceae bacterium]|nr:ADOP family duplicated permease [Gemmatimonadaceae bacterium]